MKKKFLLIDSIIKGVLFGLLVSSAAVGDGWASSELDRAYQLETIGFLKPWDNVDGLFADYVSQAYKDYFAQQSRFVLNDLSSAESVVANSRLSYKKIIADPEILAQIVRSTRTQSLVRTHVLKEGSQYLITLDWLHAPFMEQLASISFNIREPENGTALEKDFLLEPLKTHLSKLFEQVPFLGNVTGKDGSSTTVNLGKEYHLSPGDALIVGSLEEVKKHPKLKTIVDWKFVTTGKLIVEKAEENMAFCKIVEGEASREVLRQQKIIQIVKFAQSAPPPILDLSGTPEIKTESPERPHLGYVAVTLAGGSSNWQFSLPSQSASNLGGGFAINSGAKAEIWLTQDWFVDLAFGYTFWSFSQKAAATGTASAVSNNGGVSGSDFATRLSAGYSYLVTGDYYGPKGWIKLGYKSNAYNLPSSLTELTGPVSFGSIFLGIGGNVPIRGPWGVEADFNYRALTFIGQSWVGADPTSSSDFQLQVGAYYRLNTKITVEANLAIQANGAEFSNGASLNQNIITFGPSLLYYF